MKKQNNHTHEFEFLRPLKERANILPDTHFSKNVRLRLIEKSHLPKKWRPDFIPHTASSLLFITFLILTIFYMNNDFLHKLGKGQNETTAKVSLAENEEIEPIVTIDYGSGDGEIGFHTERTGGLEFGISSFFVRDNTFYILDNANQKIFIIDQDGNKSSISVNLSSMIDVYVDEQKNIYVLDNGTNLVNKYLENGHLDQTYPVDLKMPSKLRIDHQKHVIVEQSQDNFIYLESGEKASPKRVIVDDVLVKRVNDTLGKIIVYESGKKQEFDVEFEESFGAITVLEKNQEQIIFAKTEVAAHTAEIITETHVYIMDRKNGHILGAARIPLEKMQDASRYFTRVENNQIYLLSPEDEDLIVYKLTPGKHFEKRLQDKIEKAKST